MKKRIIALLLSTLLLANVTACNTAPEPNDESLFEDTDTESTGEETKEDTNTAESTMEETDTETEVQRTPTQNPPLELPSYEYPDALYPVRGSFFSSSTYLKIPSEVLITSEGTCLYIPSWNKYANISKVYYNPKLCATLAGDSVLVFNYSAEESEKTGKTTLLMQKIQKESLERTQTTIELSHALTKSSNGEFISKLQSIYCGMLNSQDGYLLVFASETNMSDIYLASLLKTHDGGEHWEPFEMETTRISSQKNFPTVAHFFDEANGIIATRTGYGTSVCGFWVTKDGGKTWECPQIPYADYDCEIIYADDRYLELIYFTFLDGKYIIAMELKGDGAYEEKKELVFFSSPDLKTWTFIK